jgi:hypothetical protein
VIDLTKWPRLLVAGEPVTREQANDILIRTAPRHFFTNDQRWLRQVAEEYRIPLDRYGGPRWPDMAEVFDSLGVLHLTYLTNDQIMSPWVGGPHGWCDWEGRIGCSTHNIGKWPAFEDVQGDLDDIAGAWPFLRMDVQLVTDEGEGELAAMWRLIDGEAVFVEPGERLPMGEIDESVLLRCLAGRDRGVERGVSLERLREALEQARAAARGRGGS